MDIHIEEQNFVLPMIQKGLVRLQSVAHRKSILHTERMEVAMFRDCVQLLVSAFTIV